ncbi:ABC transporter substrate-binding protein [Mycoplasmatota bacterium]|nr:ABC transporter substrate-binding protein [Mycoplasmatota bacterium]
MKKIFMILAVSFGFILVGCNVTVDTEETTKQTTTTKDNTSTTEETTTEETMDTTITGPVTISFWHAFGGTKEEILLELVTEFVEEYPQVTVELFSQGDYNGLRDKTIQSIVTGNTPTMLLAYPDHIADYLTGNGVVSLDSYINNSEIGFTQEEMDDFVPAYLQENRQFDGATYGLPFNKSTEVLIYNKTYFDTNGITVPQTWDEVKTISEQIHTDTNKWGFAYDSSANLFITLTRQWGGQYTGANGELLFNNPQTIEMLDYYYDQHEAGLFTIPAEWEQNYASEPFKNQEVYMTVGSTAGIKYNVPANGAFEIGVAPIPQKDLDNKAVIQQGTNISIMSNATDQEKLAAWLLTKHLTSKESTISWAEQTGYLPVRISALEDADYQDFLNNPSDEEKYVALAEKAAFEQVSYMFYDPAFTGSSNARNEVEMVVGNVLFGGITPETALEDAIWNLEG